MTNQAMSKAGLVMAVATAMAMTAVAYLFAGPAPLTGHCGLWLPSPNQWDLIPVAGWLVNLSLMLLSALALGFMNRGFSVIQSSANALCGLYLITSASIPWIGGALSSSFIVALTMVGCMALLCSCYRQRNSTQELFAIATILSVGSMFQYAFLLMIIPVMISALLFKCMRVREMLAFGMGLIAPYWVVLGLGILPPDGFAVPSFTNLFLGYVPNDTLLVCLINIGVSALIAIILALYNSAKLYAGNTRRRLFNTAWNVLGITCIFCMIFDASNLTAYLATFYMCVAFQFANLFVLWHFRRPYIHLLIIAAIYVTMYILAIL